MKITIEPESKGKEVSEETQQRFDLRALETLLSRLEQLEQATHDFSDKERLLYRQALFSSPTIKELLMRYSVTEDDDIVAIKHKLEEARMDIAQAKNRFRPEGEPTPEVAPEEIEERGARVEIQGEINELYKINNQIEDELKRLDEELVFLEVFVTEKEEAPMGEEVVQRRIAQYEEEIQRLSPEDRPNFLQRILQKNNEPDPFEERRLDLQFKIEKALEGLESKRKQLAAQEERLHIRLQQVQVILGEEEPTLFTGSWLELVQKLRISIEKMKERLLEDFEHNRKAATELEAERDALANDTRVA